MTELELKRKRIEAGVKIAGMLVVGFLVAPFIFVAIGGLIGLVVAAGISFVIINLIPWFAMKVANWRLRALKHEASKNPIETLENQYKQREQALVEFRSNILSFHAEVQNFYSELEEHRQKYPEGVSKFEEQYSKMKALLASRSLKYKAAQKKLADFNNLIDQKRSEWKIAQAAAKMTKAAGVGEDFISKLMADTAVDSVQTSLNTAFAELEVSLLDEQPITVEVTPLPATNKSPSLLTEKAGPPTLDLEFDDVKVLEPVSVKRR
jgi:hypothetical protein